MNERYWTCNGWMLCLAVGLAALLVGCVENTSLITVNKDGSGTVKVRLKVNTQVQQSAVGQAFLASGNEGGPRAVNTGVPDAVFNREQLVEAASAMGEGVRLVGATEIKDGPWQGFLAEYEFEDIGKLNLGPADLTPKPGPQLYGPRYRFTFTPAGDGTPAKLTIVPLWQEKAEGPNPVDKLPDLGGGDPMAEEAARKLFEGMRIALYLKVDGSITNADATHRMTENPNAVTLTYVDFGQLSNNMQQLQQVINADMPIEAALLDEKDIAGFKVQDPRQQATVQFQ